MPVHDNDLICTLYCYLVATTGVARHVCIHWGCRCRRARFRPHSHLASTVWTRPERRSRQMEPIINSSLETRMMNARDRQMADDSRAPK